ncbi:MAG: hypothetical protein IPJ79_00890 [Bacteroidetes bacterium]|nr:hypothetical protein [Bacteroidota bacterium]HNR20229.1 hypothetical protein [Bacteroidia bacterium]HNU34176.1 hypothetical protein [Bacteroidia bacterium]
MTFEFKIEEKKDHVVISLKGNLLQLNQTIDFMDELNALLAQNYAVFHIYLNDLNTNSNGIQLLVNILTKARIAGGDAHFYNASKEVVDTLATLKLNMVIKPVVSELTTAGS